MDGPKLLHGKERITTDATLRRDLEDSLRATANTDPIAWNELRASLAILHAGIDHLRDQNDRMLKAVALLASNDRDLGAMVHGIGRGHRDLLEGLISALEGFGDER